MILLGWPLYTWKTFLNLKLMRICPLETLQLLHFQPISRQCITKDMRCLEEIRDSLHRNGCPPIKSNSYSAKYLLELREEPQLLILKKKMPYKMRFKSSMMQWMNQIWWKTSLIGQMLMFLKIKATLLQYVTFSALCFTS